MGDKEILEIQNLSEDDLLELYTKIQEHIKYLQDSIIDTSIEEENESEEILDEQ